MWFQTLIPSLLKSIPGVRYSLSTQLLMLTLLVVLVTEIVIMIPSVAHQQNSWLRTRTETAYLVSFAFEDISIPQADRMMVDKILMSASIQGVTLNSREGPDVTLAPGLTVDEYDNMHTINLDDYGMLDMISDAWVTVIGSGEPYFRVVGSSELRSASIRDIILSRTELQKHLRGYALNILGLSLLISGVTAGFVYFSLNRLIIRPVQIMRKNMSIFESDPENPDVILKPSERVDEIGAAERGLAALESRMQNLLNERRRLAALGAGISKISHDLRNILASAQLMSDRLVASEDPRVKKLSPRLVAALDRAITLSRETLNYGRIAPDILKREPVALTELVDDIFDDNASMYIEMKNQVPEQMHLNIDRTQFHRALTNLVRNASEALMPDGPDHITDMEKQSGLRDRIITISAVQQSKVTTIDIIDNGPGLPETAKEFLFEPFKGSYKPGGSGLGVAISAEIMRAHGGELRLHKSDEKGATFRIILPGV